VSSMFEVGSVLDMPSLLVDGVSYTSRNPQSAIRNPHSVHSLDAYLDKL